MFPLLLLVSILQAQQTSGGDTPALNAQYFRPSLDSQGLFWLDDAQLGKDRALFGRFLLQWANEPLVYETAQGEQIKLVDDLFQLDLMGGTVFGPLRVGVDLPIYLRSTGEAAGGETGLGDIALDVKGRILDGSEAPLGLAIGTRLGLPTATVDASLGADGFVWDLGVKLDKAMGDTLLVANLGTRAQPRVELENAVLNEQLVYGLGAFHRLSDAAGVGLELVGHASFGELGNAAANPLEAILGGWMRPGGGDLVLRGGLGLPLSRGIGAPQNRVLLALAYEPEATGDWDMDGLADDEDACPRQAEDMDQYEDGDGCPEPTPVILHFVDEEGNPIPQVDSRLGDVSGQGELNASLEPGSYPVTVTSREYEDLQDTLQVPAGPPVERTYTLALVPPGTLVVAVTGPDGEPVPATVTVNGQAVAMEGELRQPRKQGPVKLAIQAEGYLSRQIQDEVRPGEETVIQVQLEKELVAVEKERIDLKDSVYFETARDVIKQESYTLLEQVATVMADHPEILLLRIEGHTDSRGDDAYNLDLSKRRAAAVKAFLVEKGVEEARLQSEGYGETRPLDPAENTAAWTKNRRVDFFIAQRSDEEE